MTKRRCSIFHRQIWWFYDWLSEMGAPLKASNGLVVIFRSPAFWRRGGGRRRISNTSILPNTKEYLTEHRAKIRMIKLQRKQEFSLLCYWWFWISDKFLGTLNILLSKSSVLLSCFLKKKKCWILLFSRKNLDFAPCITYRGHFYCAALSQFP